MHRRPSNLALAITTFWMAASALAVGCDNPAPTPGGGLQLGGSLGVGGAGGSSSTGGGGRGGTSQVDAAPDSKQLNCSPKAVSIANITDFSDWDDATGTWGTLPGLTGTSFVYPISAPLTPKLVVVDASDAGPDTEAASDTDAGGDDAASSDTDADTDAGVDTDDGSETGAADAADAGVADDVVAIPITTHLRLTGTIHAGQVAGIGFDFGPVCTDVSRYGGIAFTMSGATGRATPRMLVKTDDDVPTNGGGHCPGTVSAGCVLPSKTFVVPALPSHTILGWGGFFGGQPTMNVDARAVLGVEWQFECPVFDGSPDCVVDVTLDDVRFVDSVE